MPASQSQTHGRATELFRALKLLQLTQNPKEQHKSRPPLLRERVLVACARSWKGVRVAQVAEQFGARLAKHLVAVPVSRFIPSRVMPECCLLKRGLDFEEVGQRTKVVPQGLKSLAASVATFTGV